MCAIEIFSIISTHDLTKRSTFQLREMNLTETFQLTTSRRGRHYRRSQSHIPISISTHDLTKRSTAIFPPIKTNGAFQLTTSRRGRPWAWSKWGALGEISTHDLTKRSTSPQPPYLRILLVFQLTTSRRGRLWYHAISSASVTFQLTTSRRGRQRLRSNYNQTTAISTHDLTKRSTVTESGSRQKSYKFQLTTSRRGRPSPSMQADHTYIFQLTTSRRGRRKLVARWNLWNYFNSRPHEEVYGEGGVEPWIEQPFQLTTSQGGRPASAAHRSEWSDYFNSRPRKEVDDHGKLRGVFLDNFNSRPRKEVDAVRMPWCCNVVCISTHDLARRSTQYFSEASFYVNISTHDLARRSTLSTDITVTWLTFQLTTSQGGRQRITNMDNLTQIFQLTTSQGGRLQLLVVPTWYHHFNSRPRKEVDF